MNVPAEFNDIRPYTPEEIPLVVEELANDPQFRYTMETSMPAIPFDTLVAKARQCKTAQELHVYVCYAFVKKLMDQFSDGVDMDASCLDKNGSYTFISNHRDIVLDAAFLCKLLVNNGFRTTAEIALGNNLLAYPWIEKVVKLCKGFIVKRQLALRDRLMGSRQLSGYIHFSINQKKENVWIAQREGRAKDSDDHTQQSIIKMLTMGTEGTLVERLKNLHIVPLTISYEFDPCDFLKAREFQMKRDDPNFKKSREDDILNMNTGIFGYKGRVHYQAAACMDEWLDQLPADTPRPEFFEKVAVHMDHVIHSNYRLFPNNYIAYDRMFGTERFESLYSEAEKQKFETYIHTQIEKIDLPEKDFSYLEHKLLEMYVNPLLNYLKAAEIKSDAL